MTLQPVQSLAQGHDSPDQVGQDDPWQRPWLTMRQAAIYVGNRSLKAFYIWRKRHGIVCRANGTVARRDLDRALDPRLKRRRVMHPASLANLQRGAKRHGR